MIRLNRGAAPPILGEKGAEWTREFVEHTGPRSEMPVAKRYRYRHPDIKAAVVRDSHGKCVYCESAVTHIHPGETEHIRPSSKYPALVVEWNNLAFVCTGCNREKLDYDEPELQLLDPFADEPSEHLAFYGPMILHKTGRDRGDITVRRLKLNERPSLFERRKERVEQIQGLLDRITLMADGPLKSVLEGAVDDEAADDQPYAAVVRAFIQQARDDLR